MILKILFLCLNLLLMNSSFAENPPEIRIGVMASGTLAWELAAMPKANPDFALQTVNLANQQAGKIALQSGSVDIIISDWIWTSTMRAEGADYSFYPYSTAAGGLLVPADSPIKTIADLKGKKLGIAGGELDKNWLLLQALGQKQGIDLNKSVEKVYGAPPILNQQINSQRLDALLTYWQFASRLEAQGYRQLLSGEDIIRQLGIETSVPSLGYVFKTSWADQHKSTLLSFLQASKTARDKLCSNDSTWQSIQKLTEAEDVATQLQLRNRYCQGRITQWDNTNRKAAENIYELLHQLDDNKLTSSQAHLKSGVFWQLD